MLRKYSAKLALWVAVGAGFCSLAPSTLAISYDRNAAVAYANQHWNKVVSDGYFWINGSTAKHYGAGQPVPVNASGEASGIGDDCATSFPVLLVARGAVCPSHTLHRHLRRTWGGQA